LATESFFEKVQSMLLREKEFRMSLCLYPMVAMLRLFKSFAAQQRLAIVTATLSRASQDILHFAIVFLSVFVCMMVNSVLFFGQDVQEFVSVPRAFHTCFRAMMGDWDWHKMMEIGYFKAQIWFWLFLIVMVLILLNMMLAIIMDAYTAEKGVATNAQTIVEQCKEMMRRRRQFRAGERVKLNNVYDAFLEEYMNNEKDMLQDDRLLKPDDVAANVDKMKSSQAFRLLWKSLEHAEHHKEITEEQKKEMMSQLLDDLERRTDEVEEDSEYMSEKLSYFDRLRVDGDPEYDFYFRDNGDAATAAKDDLAGVVSKASADIGGVFLNTMSTIEGWQGSLETQQNELHRLVKEMQIMVAQQASCVAAISEAVSQLGCPSTPPVENQE